MSSIDLRPTDEIVARLGRRPEALIPILQALQGEYGYLPREALEHVCRSTEISAAAVAGVSSFYDMFRLEPAGRHTVRVCRGTACHVSGAERLEEALRRHLEIPSGQDTDPDRQFTIETVACLGCCTLAPVVRFDQTTFGHGTAEKVPALVQEFLTQVEAASPQENKVQPLVPNGRPHIEIQVGLGSCCMAKGSDRLYHALQASAAEAGPGVVVKRVGCVGMCHRTPLITVAKPGQPTSFYAELTPHLAPQLLAHHARPHTFLRRLTSFWTRGVDALLLDDNQPAVVRYEMSRRDPAVKAFLDKQVHLATEHFGKLDPLDLDEYVSHEGFVALRQALQANHTTTLQTVEASGLRGRGGAGFPSGPKWRMVREQAGPTKYVICNGDEGDPGAFMDRMILESFPYRVIEGLAIAAVTVGAHEGIFYIRHEYPLAVRRVQAALDACLARGWLGDRLMGSDYPLHLSIKQGAGAFVCGEETALIASLEGKRGMPRLRPPFPAQSGLWGRPTLINNVETLALVPWIVRHGASAFKRYGTPSSSGTKVFALAGKIRRGGLIEVPMGTTIREIVEEMGGGPPDGRRFKAVQIGGPSGGCIPARLADTPVDYESLRAVGAIMGSGGLVVLDDSDCMVDMARYFLQFTQEQSCGKCTFCRVGTKRMLGILDRLCNGQGQRQHLLELEHLAAQVHQGSLCGLGKTAPNPVLSTLRYFRDEYEAHLQGHCPAGRCRSLVHYRVAGDCNGCTLCAQHCPVEAIPMTPYRRHEINQQLCTKCDSCRQICPKHAIEIA